METNCEFIPYEQTGFFSDIFIDYLKQDEKLAPFYIHPVSIEGIKSSIAARQQFKTNRSLLVQQIKEQYSALSLTPTQQHHLNKLGEENTFTITTAHQPNIFTGHLYFIYKILHTVKLSKHLCEQLPDYHFVPVFYMGSEDADLEELGHINLTGEKLEWNTKQTGAVGRMKVDKELVKLIDLMAGQLEVLDHGKELIKIFRAAYTVGTTIQQATLYLLNELFGSFGLLVLLPDNVELKRSFNSVVKRELEEQFSHAIVEETSEQLNKNYKVQASGREVNLFYLLDDHRERIELTDGRYEVKKLDLQWTLDEVLHEVESHPERFSANVILRGVFQEMVLPNIAFIGGGGEIAYWLELKKVFEACDVPFPMLIIRNSFLMVNAQQQEKLAKLQISDAQTFQPALELVNELVKRNSELQLTLTDEKEQLKQLYQHVQHLATTVDVSLHDHVISLEKRAAKAIDALEKKMLKAERKKFEAQQRQITSLKEQLFPGSSLQERVDNFAIFYATYGKNWLQVIYNCSQTLEQEFGILKLR